MIFCYGNCNKAYGSNHSGCSHDGGGGGGKTHSNSIHPSPVHQPADSPDPITPTGEVMMKNLWLEMYNNSNNSLTDNNVQRGVVPVRS